ncbi:MAG: CinA family protein [Bacteroidota bacterium]|nr:CinA family protein [Bacteroidota bacterium]
MPVTDKWQSLVKEIAALLTTQNKTVSVAESCTGGNISAMLTSISGSSNFFKGGIIAYSKQVKMNLLQVKKEDLEKYSAVSEQVANQMADGIRSQMQSDYTIATTGFAGPTGDNVGQVFFAFSSKAKSQVFSQFFEGDRREIVSQASIKALSILLSEIKK